MTIIGITGPMRSGKTLLAAMIGYRYIKDGRRVMCNFRLKGMERYVTAKELEKAIKDKNTDFFREVIIILDEVQTIIDGRGSGTITNKLLSYFVLQTGKLRSTLIWTSQNYMMPEKRLRIHTDTLYTTSRGAIKDSRLIRIPPGVENDPWLIIVDKHTAQATHSGLSFIHKKTVAVDPRGGYSLYDTGEAIFPD